MANAALEYISRLMQNDLKKNLLFYFIFYLLVLYFNNQYQIAPGFRFLYIIWLMIWVVNIMKLIILNPCILNAWSAFKTCNRKTQRLILTFNGVWNVLFKNKNISIDRSLISYFPFHSSWQILYGRLYVCNVSLKVKKS